MPLPRDRFCTSLCKIDSPTRQPMGPDRPASVRFRTAHCSKAARALLHHDSHNGSTAFRMRSLYALHRSLSVAIPAIQPRLRLSGTNRLRFALHGGQRSSNPNSIYHSVFPVPVSLRSPSSTYLLPGIINSPSSCLPGNC